SASSANTSGGFTSRCGNGRGTPSRRCWKMASCSGRSGGPFPKSGGGCIRSSTTPRCCAPSALTRNERRPGHRLRLPRRWRAVPEDSLVREGRGASGRHSHGRPQGESLVRQRRRHGARVRAAAHDAGGRQRRRARGARDAAAARFHLLLLLSLDARRADPAQRGPVNWAILNGEVRTGATLHYMVDRADAGDIVDQLAVPILEDDDAREVFGKVTAAAEIVLARSLPGLIAGDAPRR